MDTNANRILAVIDPTRTEQWALQKAIAMQRNRSNGARVFAFLCAHATNPSSDPAELKEAELRRNRLWLDEILGNLAVEGVQVEPLVEWHSNWRLAVCEAAASVGADIVIKRASGRQNSLGNSDRFLIRHLRDSAVLVLKHEPTAGTQKVLIAVDFNATDKKSVDLNKAIMALGKSVRGGRTEVELHSISAYSQSDRFIHPQDVAKSLGIPRGHAHVRLGNAADVIPQTAEETGAHLVIVGNAGRRGISGITIGNTAEKILADISADVLVLVHELDGQLAAA